MIRPPKRRASRNYHSDSSFVDLLFNVFLGFVALFFIALLMINPVSKKKSIELKAEFIIKVTWSEDTKDDVDTYLEDPAGNVLFYNARDVGLMHLDRDDLGSRNDTVTLPDGEVISLKENREIVTVRGVIKGEYVLNVHLFNKNSSHSDEDPNSNEVFAPVEVNVEILKLNPYKVISIKKLSLVKSGDELTVLRFTLDEKGKVIEVNDLEKSLVEGVRNGEAQGQSSAPQEQEDDR